MLLLATLRFKTASRVCAVRVRFSFRKCRSKIEQVLTPFARGLCWVTGPGSVVDFLNVKTSSILPCWFTVEKKCRLSLKGAIRWGRSQETKRWATLHARAGLRRLPKAPVHAVPRYPQSQRQSLPRRHVLHLSECHSLSFVFYYERVTH
jgi:hypothetical protein